MKNIKIIALPIICICIVTIVQAQSETKKPADRQTPQVALPPVQEPVMPNAPKPVNNTEPVAETPSPMSRDKKQLPAEAEKPNFQVVEYKEPETPGGEEGKKIMAGKTTKSAPVVNNYSTIDQTPPPQPAKPANMKQQQ